MAAAVQADGRGSAARRGNASLARRLRPEDLWLPEDQHTVPAARGWVWDLRPLAHGLPAQVIAVGETAIRDDLNRHAISIFGIDYTLTGGGSVPLPLDMDLRACRAPDHKSKAEGCFTVVARRGARIPFCFPSAL